MFFSFLKRNSDFIYTYSQYDNFLNVFLPILLDVCSVNW